ncbi:protein-tyrosine-phosphatase [Bhargavaea ullalensis]|uniref:protein-tyrosine-phosphatase n=1 Tax=Bhargavaea ullalensis TaxID=1265685 RepID=A0ABV2GED6_9BACL
MVSVLFVCLGNICRSPMAEAVMRRLVEDRGLSDEISVDSAGPAPGMRGKHPMKARGKSWTRKGFLMKACRPDNS